MNNKQSKQEYRKIMSRSLSLISVRSWYLSDKKGLLDATNGTMFFEPLFIREDGKGVSVYYDFSDKQQDPKLLLPYFHKNMEKFAQLVNEYESDCKEILKLTATHNQENFEKVYNLLVKTWPMLAISNTVGAMNSEEKYGSLIEKAYEIRTTNDTIVYAAEEFLLKIIQEILGYGYQDLADYVFPEEIIQNKIPDIDTLNARKKRYIYFGGVLDTEIEADEFCKKKFIELEQNNVPDVKFFKGSVAHKGFVTGKVVVIFEKPQMDKVSEGDILVTPMTTPDFLPAMKKAAAFVTDEGGITCHAAIVARELGKPCIIGTKIATQVLKDGDVVEVDAEKGVVKILNKQ